MRDQSILEAFGTALREQRARTGLSQEPLGLTAEVDLTFVSQIERGLHQPSLTTQCKLAEALNIRASTLVARMEKLIAEGK